MCDITTKLCSKCKEEKPLTKDYFYKRSISSDGFRSECKLCCKKNRKKEWDKKYRDNNKEIVKKSKENWLENNSEKRRIWEQEYKSQPLIRLKNTLRARNRRFLEKGWKTGSTRKIIGCSFDELKLHLEKQFLENMSWENYGIYGWHIDHIIPLSSAQTKEELIKLNHYTNLQPLWAEDNLRKSDKISEEWGNEV